MRLYVAIFALLLVSIGSASAQKNPAPPNDQAGVAKAEFTRAQHFGKSGQTEEAFDAVSRALQLSPRNAEYLATQEMLRQRMVNERLEAGNRLADTGDNASAATQFRAAISLDPQNEYLQQRLRDVSPDDPERQRTLQLLASVDQIELTPAPGKKNIHVRGDTRTLYTEIARAFNLTAQFDDNLASRNVRFDLDDVDFYTAAGLAGKLTHTFWSPMTKQQIIVATDNPEMRRQYERLSLRTFYLGNALSVTDLTDIVNVLRNVFQVNIVNAEGTRNAITVRAPKETVEAAASFIENIMDARPEFLIDVQEVEIDTDKSSQYGLLLPTSFEAFNVFSEINRVLGPDAQPVINQLKTTGTVDPSTIPSGDLSNLQGSPLLSPFVFFGGGYGLTGLSTPPISGHLSKTMSISTNVEHAILRAIDGEKVTFKVGSRFPLVTATFSNVAITGQSAALVGNTPQFQYTDLGLTLNIKPHYQINDEIRMDFEFEVQGLGTASVNNIPELTTRSFKGSITVKAGEPSVITGQINEQESRATSGYPGIGQLPVLQSIINTNNNDHTHNQVLIVVTPHVIRKPFHDGGSTVWWNAPNQP
jgi:general secretion pathway protein D